ncbi:hypothetical protein [Pseudomonas graminis]
MSTVPITYDFLTESPASAFPAVPLRDPNNPSISYTLYPETAVVGLGRRQVLPDTRFTIQAWYENNLNDYYEINVEGQKSATASDIVRAVRSTYDLTIPGTVMPEGEASMYARVVRAISRQESRSVPQTILIKTTIPGGIDREVGDSWVSGLSMRIENLPEYSTIDANVAARGMVALIDKYENCRVNDSIVLFASGLRVLHTVSPAEAAGPGPIRIPISPDVIRAGNQRGDYQIAFKVIDVVKNVSGGVDAQYPYSKPYILNSELDPSLLPYPLLLADGVESPVVDLGTQSNSIFSVEVSGLPLVRPLPASPNQIVLVFTITDANGFISTLRLPRVASLNLRSQTIPVDSSYIRRMAGNSVRLSFEVQNFAGSVLNRSGSYPFQVVSAPVATYPAPAFNGTRGTQTVNTQTYATSGAPITIAYSSMSTAHTIRPKWMFSDGTFAALPVQSGRAAGSINVAISPQIIQQSAGRLVSLVYEVTMGAQTVLSEVSQLTFLPYQTPAVPLVRDVTRFDDYSFNGWVIPNNVDARDFRFILHEGAVGLYNNTFTNASDGIILKKTFTNLKVGATYSFSMQCQRWIATNDVPWLFLSTNQGPVTPPTAITIVARNFQTLIGYFTALTSTVECRINNAQRSGVGNDFRIALTEIRYVSG